MNRKGTALQIDLEPIGRRVDIAPGNTLLDAAHKAGVELVSICGGMGSCQGCLIRLLYGELSAPTQNEIEALDEEALAAGFRLACQAIPIEDVGVYIPPASLRTAQRLQIEGLELKEVQIEADVLPLDLHVDPPSIQDQQADAERLVAAAEKEGIHIQRLNLPLLATLPDRLRDQDWSIRLAVRREEIVAILPAEAQLVGLAIDVGTSKLALYLVDLSNGNLLASKGAMNPQVAFGEDVMSRITHTMKHEDGLNSVQTELITFLNHTISRLCVEAGVSPEQVVEAVVVGNTAMHHLFLGLPVRQLGLAPYVPAVNQALDVPASDIGLDVADGAYVHLPPNIAGFVGADHVAMLLATEAWKAKQTTIALDIGTNTEVTLAFQGRMLSCSCASGPAFEGAHIRDGMRAAPGAIEHLKIVDGEIRFNTIDDKPAIGICGSGILDAVAEMRAVGAIDSRGTLQPAHPLVLARGSGHEFVLASQSQDNAQANLGVTRKDVNEIQLAKGAIRAGVEVLLEESGLQADDIDEFIIAGAFGTYIDVGSAIQIGMFPALPINRFRQVGNAAGMGAKYMLISTQLRSLAQEIARKCQYVELTTHPRFTEFFMESLNF